MLCANEFKGQFALLGSPMWQFVGFNQCSNLKSPAYITQARPTEQKNLTVK
jgi:hypothetical protein